MTEMVIPTGSLPELVFQLIQTTKVKVRQHHGEVHLIPVHDNPISSDCPLLGLYADGVLTVEKHFLWSREDKELEP